MDRNQYQTAKEVLTQLNGVEVNERKGGKLKFRMYITQEMCDTPIDNLELSVRSYHSLKRADLNTIGDIAEAIKELDTISNKFSIEIVISLAVTKGELPGELQDKVIKAV